MATLDKTIRIKVDSSGAEKKVNSLDDSIEQLDDSAKQTNKSFGLLKTSVIAVSAALQASQIIKYADAFTSIQNQIRQTTKTSKELAATTQDLLSVSNKSRTSFEATAQLYTDLTLSTKQLNLNSKDLLRLTETISKSFSVSGKSAAESAGAIRQLGQALAAGALRGDEFNSIAENAPEIMRALQRSLNLTQGELREFAATGGITAEILVNSLGQVAEVVDDKIASAQKTFAQFTQEAESNAIAFVGSSELINTSVTALGETLVFLSDNIETIGKIGLVALAAALSRTSALFIANSVAALRSASAMGIAATAATGLNRAMSLLGGPLGIILTAASAVAIFATDADSAGTHTQQLSEEVEKLSESFQKLNRQQLDVKLANATATLNKTISEYAELNAKVVKLEKERAEGTRGASLIVLNNLRRQRDALKEVQAEAQKTVDALFGAGIAKNLEGATDQSGVEVQQEKAPAFKLFKNNEKFKTDALRSELKSRLEMQAAFNNAVLADNASFEDQRLASIEFRKQQELISLQKDKEASELGFLQRRESILLNERLDSEAKLQLQSELQQQELTQTQIFESEKVRIASEAAREIASLERASFSNRINSLSNYANSALSLNAAFGSKSEKGLKKQRRTEVVVNGAAGIARAWADLPYPAAVAATIGIAASTAAQLKTINSASSAPEPGGGNLGSISAAPTAQRQEPIQQTRVLEFRGLSEVAAELGQLDPGEVLPAEYTQRIVESIAEFERFSGETL